MKRKENDCLLLKTLIAQNQINSSLFETGSNIIFDDMDDEEVVCCLLKVKQTYFKHAITSMASHFLLANTLMSAALVAASYMNIAWI